MIIFFYWNVYQLKLDFYLKFKQEMNQYDVRQKQIQNLIETRQNTSQAKQEWDYKELVGKTLMAPRFKYQNVEMSHKLEFIDDIQNLIYDQKRSKNDSLIFTSSDWSLAPVQQKKVTIPEIVPHFSYIQKQKMDSAKIDQFFGKVQLEGKINAKCNEIHYSLYHFNLRSRSLFFYLAKDMEQISKQTFYIMLNQRSYDYLSLSPDFFQLRGQTKSVKIRKDQQSKQLISILQKKLFFFSFRGVFVLRDEVPCWQMADYINQQVDTIGPIRFSSQSHLKDIVGLKYYKESMGAFFHLLKINAEKRKNISGQIMLPKWLKQQFKDLPYIETQLITNVVPPHNPLMSLKVKIDSNNLQSLAHAIKYVFPFFKNYVKRSLIVYDSQLEDEHVDEILTQISYPMYLIGFPTNNLSIDSLQKCIQSASNLYQQVVDYSYNTRLGSIGQTKLFSLINTNPSIKSVILKGCYIQQGDEDNFFQGMTNNLCLRDLQIDYLDHYGSSGVKHLKNYDAHIY